MNKITSAFRSHFDPGIPLLFVLGAMAFSIAGNAAYELVKQLLGEPSTITTIITILIVAILIVFLSSLIVYAFGQMRALGSLLQRKTVTSIQRKAVIISLSPHKGIAQKILENQKPSFVGIIFTKLSSSTLEELRRDYPEALKEETTFCEEADAMDVQSVYAAARKIAVSILAQRGVGRDEMAIDVTGGTVPMSIGSFRAAEDLGISTQYVRSHYDDSGKRQSGNEDIELLTRAF